MKRNVTAALAALILALVLCAPLHADIAFTTSDYTNGTLGRIGTVDGAFAVLGGGIANFGGDAIVHAYNYGNRMLVIERSATGEDNIYVYDPDDLSRPIRNTTWTNVKNIYDVEYMFGYLYAISYDGKVVKVETNNFTKVDEWNFDNTTLPEGYTGKGVALAQLGGELFALFTVADAAYPPTYRDSKLVNLSDALVRQRSVDLPENTHTLATFGGKLYAAGWGGAQEAGADAGASLVQRIDIGTTTLTPVTLFSGAELGGGQVAAFCFGPNGQALLATHKYDDAFNATVKLHMIDTGLAVSSAKTLGKTLDGWSTSIVYDSATDRFWVANANGGNGPDQIMAFHTSDGAEVANFSAAQLGGPAYSLAPVKRIDTADGGDDDGWSSGGGGGCAAGAYGFALLLCGYAALRKRARA